MTFNVSTKSDDIRRNFVGGSDARIIMGDDEPALLRLWREKRGEVEPEDLSRNLVVQLGLATEDLNRRWYESNTGQVLTDVQRRIRHPALRWMAATLDGRVEATGTVFGCRAHRAGFPGQAGECCERGIRWPAGGATSSIVGSASGSTQEATASRCYR